MPSIFDTINTWAAGTSYSKNNIVLYNSMYFYSLENSNQGNVPTSTLGSKWDGIVSSNSRYVPDFFWKPSYSSQVVHQPRIIRIKFGNGYEQRIEDGINTNLINLDLTFENRDETEAVAILHFLSQRNSKESFIFNVPTAYSKSTFSTRFLCSSWNSTYNFYNNYSIRTTFEEVSA